jgi:hypothetical protein
MCKCSSTNIIAYGVRSFCLSCSYLVPSNNITHMTICPSCNSFESWEQIGAPCLSCQFASIRFQNPFETRLEILINTWLPVSSEMENNNLDDYDDNDDDTCTIAQTIRHPAGKTSQDTLFKLWHAVISESLNEICSKSSIRQIKDTFQGLTRLQRELQNNKKDGYLTYDPSYYDGNHDVMEDNTLGIRRPLASLEPNISLGAATLKWPSCDTDAHLDPTSLSNDRQQENTKKQWWAHGSSNQIRRYLRTLQKRGV